ncbi:MAG: DUF222 domain-containing protein [Frankiaceae bacterium]|nr:DUF222 domain-containing protein [Frankiaceae bacterium]
MFEVSFGEPPEGWEPIPHEVLAEVDWNELDPPPVGMRSLEPDDFVGLAINQGLSADALGLIAAVPPEQMSDAARSHALRRLEQMSAHIDELKVRITAAIAGPAPVDEAARRDDFSSHEVGVATKCSVYAADGKVAFARDLASRFRATAHAMREGRITLIQAKAMAESLAHLDDEIAQKIESRLLAFSYRQDLTSFKAAIRRWRIKLDPTWTPKAEKARAEVVVEHTPGDDGTGEIYIRGPLEHTAGIAKALDAEASKTKHELGGTAAARKLAALRDMVDRYLASPNAAKLHGRLPFVNVTIDLATLLKLRDGIAEIVGVGAVPADVARWLLADGAPLRRLVIDPLNGQLLDTGTNAYTVPPWLAEHLIGRNPTAAAPHSHVPSAGCDMEHNVPHDRGGATNLRNNTPVDRRWHRAKTHAEWSYEKDHETGVVVWTSPVSGLTCEIHPYDYRAGP